MSKTKSITKTFKIDPITATTLAELCKKTGANQSEVMRNLILRADAQPIATEILKKVVPKSTQPVRVDLATGGVVKQEGMGFGTTMLISAGAGITAYYMAKEIRKRYGKEEDFEMNYLVGMLSGLGMLGLLSAVFKQR